MCLKDVKPRGNIWMDVWEHVRNRLVNISASEDFFFFFPQKRFWTSKNRFLTHAGAKNKSSNYHAPHRLHTHSHTIIMECTQSRRTEGSLCLRVTRRDKASARNYDPRIPFICSTSGGSIAAAGTHPSSDSCQVDTTYPRCTAAAARSTQQWTPRWPARCRPAALWRWCGESCPLVPAKRAR